MGLIEFKLRVKRKRDKVSAGDLNENGFCFFDVFMIIYLEWIKGQRMLLLLFSGRVVKTYKE